MIKANPSPKGNGFAFNLPGGGEPPTPSVVYLNLERTEYELCGLVRLLIMGKQTLKKGYKDL